MPTGQGRRTGTNPDLGPHTGHFRLTSSGSKPSGSVTVCESHHAELLPELSHQCSREILREDPTGLSLTTRPDRRTGRALRSQRPEGSEDGSRRALFQGFRVRIAVMEKLREKKIRTAYLP